MILVLIALGAVLPADADSGGPYAFVPDLRDGEVPPTVAIDADHQRPLPYFLDHVPRPRADEGNWEPNRIEWEPVPGDLLADLVRVGRVGARWVYAVRYLPRVSLDKGFDAASGILVVADVPQSQNERFHPVFFSTAGATHDHTVSRVFRSGAHSFVIVRRHYAGQGNHVDRIALWWDRERQGFVRGDLAAGGSYWKALRAEGWKPRSRGHGFDEETLEWIHSVYREVDGVERHAVVRVPVRWDGARFQTGDPVFDGER